MKLKLSQEEFCLSFIN